MSSVIYYLFIYVNSTGIPGILVPFLLSLLVSYLMSIMPDDVLDDDPDPATVTFLGEDSLNYSTLISGPLEAKEWAAQAKIKNKNKNK